VTPTKGIWKARR